jgi:hypothetical protein
LVRICLVRPGLLQRRLVVRRLDGHDLGNLRVELNDAHRCRPRRMRCLARR